MMPELKNEHVPPFKFAVDEKVWCPGISDVAKIKERIRNVGAARRTRSGGLSSERQCG